MVKEKVYTESGMVDMCHYNPCGGQGGPPHVQGKPGLHELQTRHQDFMSERKINKIK